MDILGLGMSLLDTVQVVDKFPSGSGVTEVLDSTIIGGGPVPTALCAASRLGAETAIIDRIGDDWRGDLIASDYRRFGVDCRWLTREPGRSSGLGTVLVRRGDGERHLMYQQGTASPLNSEELPQEAMENCRILHLNGRHWPACLDAAARVRASGGLVSFDGGANRYDSKFRELLAGIDILIVARDFAEQHAGSTEREAQLDTLIATGAGIVGITDGARGSWFLTDDGDVFHQPAFECPDIVDTTGCGDVFHGAFLYALAKEESVRRCATIASAAASLSASALGGRGHLPTRHEVDQLVS